jgi:hypothetical protein
MSDPFEPLQAVTKRAVTTLAKITNRAVALSMIEEDHETLAYTKLPPPR